MSSRPPPWRLRVQPRDLRWIALAAHFAALALGLDLLRLALGAGATEATLASRSHGLAFAALSAVPAGHFGRVRARACAWPMVLFALCDITVATGAALAGTLAGRIADAATGIFDTPSLVLLALSAREGRRRLAGTAGPGPRRGGGGAAGSPSGRRGGPGPDALPPAKARAALRADRSRARTPVRAPG